MKHTLLLLLFSYTVWGQVKTSSLYRKHIASADFCSFYTPLFASNFFGLNFDFKYYVSKRFATGLTMSTIIDKRINNTFSYPIINPLMSYSEYGWINQFDFIQTHNLRVNLNLNNAIAKARLGGNAAYQNAIISSGGNFGGGYSSTVIAVNYFYILEPGLDVAFRIANSYFYIIAKSKYRFAFGDTKFGTANQFSGCYFGIGVSIISSTD
jgi:hypothetical protein